LTGSKNVTKAAVNIVKAVAFRDALHSWRASECETAVGLNGSGAGLSPPPTLVELVGVAGTLLLSEDLALDHHSL
jgi:hypothetical protein